MIMNWKTTLNMTWGFKMKFNVTEVEFDFDDDYAEESKLTFDEEIEIRDLALGVWDADDEDDLIEEVTTACGWCIKNIDYEIQLEDYSLGNQDNTFIDINNTGGKY